MWLNRTVFNHYILKGKIPGSSDAVKDDLNAMQITIQQVACSPTLPILDDHEHVDSQDMLDIVREINSYNDLGVRDVNCNGEDKDERISSVKLLSDKVCSITYKRHNSIFNIRDHKKANTFNHR